MTCDECGRSSLIKGCETHKSNKEARVCKDCCIGRMAGHKCRWWDLCWS